MNILLADDDAHVVSALRLLLQDEPGIAVVGDCTTMETLVDLVSTSGASMVLLDWDLPGLHGTPAVERLLAAHPECGVLVLSGRPEQRQEALRAGARAFVSKGDGPEKLLAAIRLLSRIE